MINKEKIILEATSKLIGEKGVDQFSMEMVADEAKVGTGTIYRYFKNKDDLITRLHDQLKLEFNNALLSGFDSSLPIRRIYRTLWKNIVFYNVKNPKNICCIENYKNSYNSEMNIKEMYEIFIPNVYKLIKVAIKNEILKDVPVEMIAVFTFESAVSLAKKHTYGMLELNETYIEKAGDMCWDALRR